MAKATVKDNKNVKVLLPFKEEGWYCLKEIEIPLSILESEGDTLFKTNPETFQIFTDQLIERSRKIFEI